MNAAATLPVLTALNPDALQVLLEDMGEKKYRVKQILQWVYQKRVQSWDEMTNLSAALREKLAEQFALRSMSPARTQGSQDTTQKFLFKLRDGRFVESVLIPASVGQSGERSKRRTLCISSQVGCAYGCKFCASGLAGFARNLTTDEIVEQFLLAEQLGETEVNNLVFMGMGEPLANLSNLLPAIEILNAHWGLNIGARHITVSTSGLAPQIEKLADQSIPVRLAISLHGATNETRDKIMPVNRKYPIERLFEALRYFSRKRKQKITFEYILIDGVNDSLGEADQLVKRARSMDAKVNLIPYNTVDGLDWKRPSESRQEAFLKVLKNGGIPSTLRREKGHDIDAACGQLRLKEEIGELAPS